MSVGETRAGSIDNADMKELVAFSPTPEAEWSPAQRFWYGTRRRILRVRVQMFERIRDDKWRPMGENKPFQSRKRQRFLLPYVIMHARSRYDMWDEWVVGDIAFNEECCVCQLNAPRKRSRRIEITVIGEERPLSKKEGLHMGALIHRAIQERGKSVLKEDAEIQRMQYRLLYNGWLLQCLKERIKDGKKVCRFRAIYPEYLLPRWEAQESAVP